MIFRPNGGAVDGYIEKIFMVGFTNYFLCTLCKCGHM